MRAGVACPSVEGDVAQETLPAAVSRIATHSSTVERGIMSPVRGAAPRRRRGGARVQRGPADLATAEDALLLLDGHLVPPVQVHPDDAERLIGPAHGPVRLAPAALDPHRLVHL